MTINKYIKKKKGLDRVSNIFFSSAKNIFSKKYLFFFVFDYQKKISYFFVFLGKPEYQISIPTVHKNKA